MDRATRTERAAPADGEPREGAGAVAPPPKRPRSTRPAARTAGKARDPSPSTRRHLAVTVVVAIGMVAGALLEWVPEEPSVWRWLPLGIAYLVGGGPILRDTLESLRDGRLSIDFLMGAAALGAAGVGQPLEGAILIFLFSLSNTLEAYAMGRTRRAIGALMDLHPEEATLIDAGGTEIGPIASDALQPGHRILVRPGERIAGDGRVADGRSEVDQSAITGESTPVGRGPGDDVFAGTINQGGAIVVEITRAAADTMLARIVRLVEEAREERAPAQEFIDRFAHPYTLLVVGGSVAWALLGGAVLGLAWGDAIYRATTLLVVASPCALVISTPAAVLSAIANGARNGILFKGGAVLDRAGRIDAVAFDKTGTVTIGEPRLLALRLAGGGESRELLRRVAGVERPSEHHLARAFLRAAREEGLEPPGVRDFRAIPGEGVRGAVDGRELWVGNDRMAEREGATVPAALGEWSRAEGELGRSVVLAGEGPEVLGAFSFGDRLRPGALEVIRRLRDERGVGRIVILSGDHAEAVGAIARELGVEGRAGLLPDRKVEALREMARASRGVAMVGDGVNDAPAMAGATLGIAMGAAGTDVAIETADVVLMSDEIQKVDYVIALGRRSRKVVRQNVWASVGWMGLLVVVAGTFGIPLTLAVVAHEGSTLAVVLNGLRLLRGRPPGPA